MEWLGKLAEAISKAKLLTAVVGLTMIALGAIIAFSNMDASHKFLLFTSLLLFTFFTLGTSIQADRRRHDDK